MICLNGTVYVLGGSHEKEALRTVESYDPLVNEWIEETSIPVDRMSEANQCSFKGCVMKLSKGILGKIIQI